MKYFNACKSNCIKFAGCMGSRTYACASGFGNDCINDSDGFGQIRADAQTLSAQNAKKVSANTCKDKSTGWTFFKGDQRPLIYGVELIESSGADSTYAWAKVARAGMLSWGKCFS